MRQVVLRILIVVAVVAAGLAIWYVNNQRTKERSVLSGFFESQATDVSSRVGGRILQVLTTEGDSVNKGQLLICIDAGPDQSQVTADTDAALAARARLRELESGPRPEDISKQRAALAEARANLADLSSGPRPEDIAESAAAANAARERYAEALRGPTVEEKAEAEAKYQSAVASEEFADKDATRYTSLYQLDAVTKQQYDQAQAAASEAAANRRDLEEAWIRSAKGTPSDELEEARQSYFQAKAAYDLVVAGTRPQQIDAAKARLAEAQSGLDELLAGTRPEDISQAQLAYQKAEAQLATERIDVADRAVRAPIDGIIDNVPVSVGDLIVPGTALVRLENPTDIWLRVYIPESELAQMSVGADAELRIDGIASPLPAYVESISDHGEFTPANLQSPDERGKQVFAVRLRLKQPDSRVKAGMDATVVQIGKWTP